MGFTFDDFLFDGFTIDRDGNWQDENRPEIDREEQSRREWERRRQLEEEWLRHQPGLQIIPAHDGEKHRRTPTPGQIQDIIDSLERPLETPSKPVIH